MARPHSVYVYVGPALFSETFQALTRWNQQRSLNGFNVLPLLSGAGHIVGNPKFLIHAMQNAYRLGVEKMIVPVSPLDLCDDLVLSHVKAALRGRRVVVVMSVSSEPMLPIDAAAFIDALCPKEIRLAYVSSREETVSGTESLAAAFEIDSLEIARQGVRDHRVLEQNYGTARDLLDDLASLANRHLVREYGDWRILP